MVISTEHLDYDKEDKCFSIKEKCLLEILEIEQLPNPIYIEPEYSGKVVEFLYNKATGDGENFIFVFKSTKNIEPSEFTLLITRYKI